jgi:uncharacterized repeat protein (TIGR03837 family)
MITGMRWDLFGRVVDHHGDVGFGWRLAADLAARGVDVRYWLDDRADLTWMAPHGAPGVRVGGWDEAALAEPADVVIETFGCGLPDAFLARMAGRPSPPPWIDVEYLSAEDYVERSHGLPSPRTHGPGAGLVTWYVYPGFTAATAGLLREPGLLERRVAFDAAAWWSRLDPDGTQRPHAGERAVSLFCYENPALPRLLQALSRSPSVLYAAAGIPTQSVRTALGGAYGMGALRVVPLTALTQVDYDHLLWTCDLNFVRGEDSFVRAQWAGAPFVWQAYPQSGGAHARKLEAFLDRLLADAAPPLARAVRAWFRAWNDLGEWPADWPPEDAWRARVGHWRKRLAALPDLTTALLAFAAARRRS